MAHRRRRAPRFPRLLAYLIGIILITSCSASSTPSATAEPPATVKVQLAWVHEYSSASFYAAEKNGHYKTQNLDVRLEVGGFGPNGYIVPIDQVVNGSVDFGISNAMSLIQARAEGKPVVGIATLFQRSPLAIISLEKSGIQRPQDLVGRKVLVAEGGSTHAYKTLLNLQKIDLASVTTLPRTTYGIEPLLNGEADAMVGWVINEGIQLREAGHTPNMMLVSDYGVDNYELVVFTTDKMIAERPDVVKRFLQGTLNGLRDVISNPAQGAKFVLEYDSTLDLAGQQRRLEATLPLITPAGSKPGVFNPELWEFSQQMMLDQQVLKEPIKLDSVYTLKFLDQLSTPE